MQISETSGMCKCPFIFYFITGILYCLKHVKTRLVKATQQIIKAMEYIYIFNISRYFLVFPGISREIPVFPAVLGNTLISRLFDNPGLDLNIQALKGPQIKDPLIIN